MKNQPTPIKAVILAGGSGTRLWPLSRMQLPKQFLRLQGDKTLLDATVHRLEPLIAKEDVLIVTGVEHAKGEAYNLLPKAYFWIKHQYTIDIKQQHPISPMSYCNR